MLFLIGAVFGLVRGNRPLDARTTVCAAVANALVGIALPAICYALYPAWMWGYYVDPARISPLLIVGVFALYWVPWYVGLRTHSWWAVGGGIAGQLAFIAWQWPRYSTVTTLEGFQAGVKVMPSQLPLLAWGGPAAVAVVVVLLLIARRPASNKA